MNPIPQARIAALLLISALTLTSCGGEDGLDDLIDDALDDDAIRYVAFGASDATGVGAVPPSEGYVFRILDGLDDAVQQDVNLINLGVPGAEVDVVRNEVETYLAVDEGNDTDLVTITTGANDIIGGVTPEQFSAELRNILSELTEETEAFIVIGNIPDLTRLPTFIEEPDPDVTPERVVTFNTIIAQLAAEFNVTIADLASIVITEDMVFDLDGFHPSNEGHEAFADVFLPIILPQFPATAGT